MQTITDTYDEVMIGKVTVTENTILKKLIQLLQLLSLF